MGVSNKEIGCGRMRMCVCAKRGNGCGEQGDGYGE